MTIKPHPTHVLAPNGALNTVPPGCSRCGLFGDELTEPCSGKRTSNLHTFGVTVREQALTGDSFLHACRIVQHLERLGAEKTAIWRRRIVREHCGFSLADTWRVVHALGIIDPIEPAEAECEQWPAAIVRSYLMGVHGVRGASDYERGRRDAAETLLRRMTGELQILGEPNAPLQPKVYPAQRMRGQADAFASALEQARTIAPESPMVDWLRDQFERIQKTIAAT